MLTRMIRITKLPIVVGLTICMTFFGCTRHVDVNKEMTWECAPEEYTQGYNARPDEYVRFRFVDNPRCFEVESAKNLCAELRQIGKPIINARFDVWGGRFLAAQGYRMVAVEQKPLIDVGGWGRSGANDPTGRCPIEKALEELK